jgi:hypothetical protein
MSGAIPPFPQYTLMEWCSVKAQGKLYFTLLLPDIIRDQIKEGEMGGACSTHVSHNKCINNFSREVEKKRPLGRPCR